MYRRLKNILGVSLMILAIVISQVPMPEAQAEIVKEMTEEELSVDDNSAHVVTFSMNGGTFNGNYNGYSFRDKTPVLVIDDGDVISSFPDDKLASYSGYKTESNTWYSDKECLTKYDTGSSVKQSITLYKKWYNITSDGSTLATKGFHISADGTVLYRYDGEDVLVEIPQTVAVIADGAFDNLDQNVRGIALPKSITEIDENAFGAMRDATIVYVFDSGTQASQNYGKKLAEKYEQLVYSGVYDPSNIAKIAGIKALSDSLDEETSETPEGSSGIIKDKRSTEEPAESNADSGSSAESSEDKSESSESSAESSEDKSESSESSAESSEDRSESSESDTEPAEDESSKPQSSENQGESSSVIVIDPDLKYTVTFNTGISGVSGEKREVSSGKKVSEEVSLDGETAKIWRIGSDKIKTDDGKQETTYTFQGWYKDNACTEEWDFANDVIDDDTTIYAKWDEEARAYFNVTYRATSGNEGASNIPGNQKLYEGEKLEKPANNPSIANKTFKGWYTSAGDTSSEFTSWGKEVTRDMTLYAHFEELANTVVFHMNGGGFTGNYNGTSYTDAASLKAEISVGKGISSSQYPGGSDATSFKYSNYTTDTNWYKDKECLELYAQKDSSGNDTVVKGNMTLYKKWYYTSSGFTMNASNNVLYKYSGSVADVVIPDSVTIIGSDAFASVGGISSITLPDNISDVRANAFSGVDKVSKDIIITGKSENAKNVARGLANQYARLVYEDSGASESAQSDVTVVSRAASGSIKLGTTISGSLGAKGSTTTTTANNSTNSTNSTSATGTIALGASGMEVGTTTSASSQSAAASQPGTASQSTVVHQDTASSDQQGASSSSGVVASGAKTTQKQNLTSASAPKSTQHIKDSTPKTGDPLQYRMLIVCAMFSVGVLLLLTGNGKKKRFSAS